MSILTIQEMSSLSQRLQSEGKIVVFTNGCFDLIHRGHIELLKAAKSEGDILFIGVNSDASVRRLKGEIRPLMNEEDRVTIINTLKPVDHVAIFDENTPYDLILMVRPNVLVKGADYTLEEIVGAKEVIHWGGRVVRVPLVSNTSTTRFIKELDHKNSMEKP
ncbi:MAG: D-glycero-beta-D-manno-heptose 1-phosphate adenylyltransferase [Candidatus Marinimicrobia bacterium]|nr:D-glycero-beta-D-manno-heptose 1-phosphate adenylyltransferase [Candidatus Neomarinimicrobiota bacterium]